MCQVNQGIVSGCDKVSKKHTLDVDFPSESIGDGIFVLNVKHPNDVQQINQFNVSEQLLLKPFYKNSDIKRFISSSTPYRYIIYTMDDINHERYPNVHKHLLRFKSILEKRLDTYQESYNWTCLHRAREMGIFTSPKIVVPQRSRRNTFAYNEDEWFSSADCYFITKANYNISLKYVLALLNSKVYYIWLYHKGKRKGELLELYAKPLSEIPIKLISPEDQELFIELVDEIILSKQDDSSADTSSLENEIDQLVYKLYDFSQEEIDFVENEYQQKIAISMNDSIIADSTEEDL